MWSSRVSIAVQTCDKSGVLKKSRLNALNHKSSATNVGNLTRRWVLRSTCQSSDVLQDEKVERRRCWKVFAVVSERLTSSWDDCSMRCYLVTWPNKRRTLQDPVGQTTYDLSSLTATSTFTFTNNQLMSATSFSLSVCWQQMMKTVIRTTHRFKQEYRYCDKKLARDCANLIQTDNGRWVLSTDCDGRTLTIRDEDVVIRGNAPEFQKWGPRSQVWGHTRWLKMVLLNSWGRVSY